ncbi:MAG: exodeoxyribonuclease VII large subunit [Spirochaetaceae bacterium]|jgi:exodeoxyribonuclease VII large subunit|nr:exodeoxyribonuclease VII large subunit [Spirochaetaceae bacterium]
MNENGKFTVSELTELIKRRLEDGFGPLCVEGELSNCRPSSVGHLYFTLKDGGAAISAVMFRNSLARLNFVLKDGMLLRAKGRLSVYAQRGTYQLVCEALEPAGTGDILAMLEARKRSLAAEGLFDEARKRPIPRFPETVAVVSSPSGAALQDILNILRRRASGLRIVILPAPVQGAEAAPVLARRIEQANRWNIADTLIIGRGGGSLEDLLPFSEECVVRAVAASKIPVISAVGHEIDWALCDFAADLRAPTPSAAAELVSENRGDTLKNIRAFVGGLHETVRARLTRARLLLRPFGGDYLERQFRAILQPRLLRFDDAKEALLYAAGERAAGLRRRLELVRATLEAANPNSILERGLSLVTKAVSGETVRRAVDVKPGDLLRIQPAEGVIRAAVLPSGDTEGAGLA